MLNRVKVRVKGLMEFRNWYTYYTSITLKCVIILYTILNNM